MSEILDRLTESETKISLKEPLGKLSHQNLIKESFIFFEEKNALRNFNVHITAWYLSF